MTVDTTLNIGAGFTHIQRVIGQPNSAHIAHGEKSRTQSIEVVSILSVLKIVKCCFLTLSMPAVPNCCCSFDIRTLWRSVVSARASECQKLTMLG